MLRAWRRPNGLAATLGRAGWQNSMFFNEYVKKAHLDDGILIHHQAGPRQMRWLWVNRALNDSPFGDRDRRLMTLLNLELSRLLGTKLALIGEPTLTDLSPRQRDVLICLMEGDSEKQVAVRLNISPYTVHDYVKLLHAHFDVRSRGELLARCRAFWPVLAAGRESDDSNRHG
ncbi:MAG: helix-turn-helix transcriptional regulator [Pirellulaceae bacterium]|jgi:DNA-binding CsgD family transcriptional regulator|nr:helix-turn-helix transcriptional regulator [Pirellulaceae bacterium]